MNRPRILVIEDNPATRKLLRVTLELEQFEVIEAPDGQTALRLAGERHPDLVLQDLILPDLDGIDLARMLRAMPGGEVLPIIALSGFISRTEEPRAAAAAFTATLIKPIDPAQLVAVLRKFLPSAARQEDLGQGKRLLLVDDDPVMRKLAELHYRQLGFAVTSAPGGREALEQARRVRPDVILSDVLMPEMDGFALCRAIRADPGLDGVPVLLIPSHYQDSPELSLAERVGANAILPRTPDFLVVARALANSVSKGARPKGALAGPEPLPDPPATELLRQLERATAERAELSHRCALQAAQLSLLGGIADALTVNASPEAVLREVLASLLDAAGISRGVLYVSLEGERLGVSCTIGYGPQASEDAAGFFGQRELFEGLVAQAVPLAIPSEAVPQEAAATLLARADVTSAHLIPLHHAGRAVGALLLGSQLTDVNAVDTASFARTIGAQIVQSLTLARSFQRIAASESRYRALMEHAGCAVFALRFDTTITDANRMAEQLAALPRDRLLGREITELIKPSDREFVRLRLRKRLSGGEAGGSEATLLRPDGSQRLIDYTSAVIDADGEHLFLVMATDVTDRNRIRRQAALNDKLATMGTLAAGIVHEINNPLAYLQLGLGTLVDRFQEVGTTLSELSGLQAEPDPQRRLERAERLSQDSDLGLFAVEGSQTVRECLRGAHRIRDIVKSIKGFARVDDAELVPVQVEGLLDSALGMTLHELKMRARVVKEYTAGLSPIMGSPGRLHQVFVNLLVNAAQAIPEGNPAGNQLRLRTRRRDDRLVVEISDTGAGIPPETLIHLFEPFFTTKEEGVGTGLGLSISHEIIRHHGGEILVESTPGAGTTFSVVLPLLSDRPQPTGERAPGRVRASVLLVEDDRYLLKLFARMLEGRHDVVPAAGGRTAIELLGQRGASIDVVVTDLNMPDVSGADLHHWIAERLPGLQGRMLFLSGGSPAEGARELLAAGTHALLKKPFNQDDLVRAVDALVAGRAGRGAG